jgi:NAD(P)-dependent dehydrogenase (short-subunit alcohol dehydrogenase family)
MKNAADCIVLITGATDGLGRRVAEDLAGQGATLLLHGRNPEKGREVLDRIHNATGSERLRYYNADFSAQKEVRRLAHSIAAEYDCLDVLINNAGIGGGDPKTQRRETSAEGYELRFAVNYLAPFLLTRLLSPLLRRCAEASGEARIVNVASGAQQPLDFDDVLLERDYSGMRAYAQSKLALVMFTFDLAAQLQGSGVTVNALHPASLMDTKMVREWFGSPRTGVETGARAVEYLTLSADLDGVTGEYFSEIKRARADDQAYDTEARRRLRSLSEHWTGKVNGL